MKRAQTLASTPAQVLNTPGRKIGNRRLRQLRVFADLGLCHAEGNEVRNEFLPVHG